MQLVEYWIDNQRVAFQLDGSTENGASTVLLESDDNIIRDSGWDDVGYCVAPSLAQSQLKQLIAGFTALIRAKVEEAGVRTDDGFCLEKYHRLVTDEQHAAVIKQTRVGFERHQFPLPLEVVEQADLGDLRSRADGRRRQVHGATVLLADRAAPQAAGQQPAASRRVAGSLARRRQYLRAGGGQQCLVVAARSAGQPQVVGKRNRALGQRCED